MANVVEIVVVARDLTGDGFGKAEAKASGLGATLTRFAAVGGAALAVVGYESVKMASQFDQSMEMLVTQAQVPQGKLAGLKAGVLALASQVGFSPNSLAESLYHVASNMQSMGATSQQMMNVVKVAAEGARIGNANLVDVTNALTSAVASGIPGVKNYAQAMGALNAIVGSGDMHMQDLAEAFSTGLLPVMKQYGLSLKDVGAALATFGDLNIRGQEAATKLRMAVQAMSAPAAQGKKDFAAMGMSVQQLAEDMRTGGLMKALEDLQKHYAAVGITGTKVGEALTTDFGKKAGVGLAVLLGNMDRLKSKYPDITKGANDFGGAWAATLQQTATVFAQLRGWFDALMIQIGEKLLPVVRAFGTFMLNNKTAIEIFLGVMAALIGILGVYVGLVKVITTVTKVWAAIQALVNGEMMLNPVSMVALAIIALIVVVVELIKHWKEVAAVARQVWHDIARWTDDARIAIVHSVDAAWHFIAHAFDEVRGHIHAAWSDVINFITGTAARLWHDVVKFFTNLWHDIAHIFDDIRHGAAQLVDDIVNFFTGLPGRVLGAIGNLGSDIWHSVTSGLGGLAHMIGLAHGGIVGAAGGGPRGGFTMVGEYGPELVRLPYGSQVYSSGQSAGMLGGGGGGGSGTMTVQLEFAPGAGDQLVRGLREYIRIRGGNVQHVLGQGAG